MNHTPEQIARAAGLGQHHAIRGHANKKPYWRARAGRERGSLAVWCEYIGPDYPRNPGACATDLLPVLWARGCWVVANSANTSIFADGMLGSTALAEHPDFARAICQAVVATAGERP